MAAQFSPTPEMTEAALTMFKAKAMVQIIQPIVEKYQRAILAKYQFKNDGTKELYASSPRQIDFVEKLVLEPKDTSHLSGADFLVYNNECKAARDKAGLVVEDDDCCPLLVAKVVESQAKVVLVNAMQPVTKLGYKDIVRGAKGFENLDKMVELSLKLLAPFCK